MAWARLVRRARASPVDAALAAVSVLVCLWVLVAPFTVVRYPPITDLPMHASSISAFRHWFDPSWHFQDQFEIHPIEVPYLTQYVLGALFACVMPIGWAVKLSTSVMLGLLPAGLAVYCKGLHKNPLMGVAGAALTWGTLTHWGFVNSLGAVGLMMMGLGLALMQLERPTRRRAVLLGVVSLLLFLTHVFRFPFYCVGLALAALFMWPANRRLFSILVPVLPSLACFLVWWIVRPKSIEATFEHGWHMERTQEIGAQLMQSFQGPEEGEILERMAKVFVGVGIYNLAVHALLWRSSGARSRMHRRRLYRMAGGVALTVSLAAMFAALFFWLPMSIGFWWYVYPREISVAVLCALAAWPALPRNAWLRVPPVLALLYAVLLPADFARREYAHFEMATLDFEKIIEAIPKAPKLAYMIWEKGGSDSLEQPFLHLPAWVQAEKGGWLSFHFATWNASPLRFRTTGPRDVAPDTPLHYEWHPEWFDVRTRGRYFDWFLVRSRFSADRQMAEDPTIERVDHQGTWWLYRRR